MKKVDLSDKTLRQLRGRVTLYERKLQLALVIKNRPDNIQKNKIKAYQAEIIRVNDSIEHHIVGAKEGNIRIKKKKEELSGSQQELALAELETKLIMDRLNGSTKKPLHFSGSASPPLPGFPHSSALSFNWQDSTGGGF